jgi:hypothetical protein
MVPASAAVAAVRARTAIPSVMTIRFILFAPLPGDVRA